MKRRMRLAMSTSCLIYTMERRLLEAAFGFQAENMPVPVNQEINDRMCDFLREVVEAVNSNPVDALEFYFSPTLDRVQMVDAVLPVLNKEVWSVHGPYGKYLDLSSPDPIAKECCIDGYRETILFAKDLGAKVVVVHPGHKTHHDVSRQLRMQNAIQGIKRVAEIAANNDIILAVEPMPNNEIGCKMDEIMYIIEQVNSPIVGINFDTNHLFPAVAVPEYIRKSGNNLRSIHISDQEDAERHWLPFAGNLNWKAVLQALADSKYMGPLVYETHIKNAVSVKDAVEIICQNYEKLGSLIPNEVNN